MTNPTQPLYDNNAKTTAVQHFPNGNTQRFFMAYASRCWGVVTKGGCTLFNTKESADIYVSRFPMSIGGGMQVTEMPILSMQSQEVEK